VQLKKYLDLPQKGSIIAEYIWIDASGGTRSKCKVSLTTTPTTRFGHHRSSAITLGDPAFVRARPSGGLVRRGFGAIRKL